MDTLSERLGKALTARGRDAPWLIAATGRAKQTIYNILDGTTKPDKITGETVDLICHALQINKDWFRTGKGSMDDDVSDEPGWPDILAYRQSAALGHDAVPDEYAETHKLKFRADSLQRKHLRADRLGVVYGKGDSMLPRIRTGDAILFDASDTDPKDGALFVVSYGGALLAKQLSLLGGRWFIESLNKDDPKWRKPELIDEHKGFRIHGRVRWIGSWED